MTTIYIVPHAKKKRKVKMDHKLVDLRDVNNAEKKDWGEGVLIFSDEWENRKDQVSGFLSSKRGEGEKLNASTARCSGQSSTNASTGSSCKSKASATSSRSHEPLWVETRRVACS